MKIALHNSSKSFSSRWIKYCEASGIQYKIVDCYSTNIVAEISNCDALMWHFSHMSAKDVLFAKQLLFSLQQAGRTVFPDFCTAWHFDDKVGQKYLLESINAPLVPSYVFYSEKSALSWARSSDYPKVFKLRGGAGSSNVKLVGNYKSAKKIIRKAFGRGFSQYDALNGLKERWRTYRLHKTGFIHVIKGLIRFVHPSAFSKVAGNENGYAYFQDFIPGNDSDIRVVVIDNKAFAIKRMTRKNDFRASGSGSILYAKELFSEDTIRLSLSLAEKLKVQCVAFDFVYSNQRPLLVEMSYGFAIEGYEKCEGYWDANLNWHEGLFDPCGWMVDAVIRNITEKK